MVVGGRIELKELFEGMATVAFDPEEAKGWNTVIQYDITGEGGGKYYLEIRDKRCRLFEGETKDYRLKISSDINDWFAITEGRLSGQKAFFSGKLKAEGNMADLFKMQSVFRGKAER